MTRKHVLITGGTHGIGRACVQLLAREGYLPILTGRDAAAGTELASSIPGSSFLQADLSAPGAVASLADRALSLCDGRLAGLVNNAGRSARNIFDETTEELCNQVYDLNLKVPSLLTALCLPALRAAKGSVVMISSIAGKTGEEGIALYTASKAGLIGLTKALALEIAPEVRINAVCPGQIETRMMSDKNLNKIYGKPGGKSRAVHAVNDVSFDLRAGETLSVVGESGSGKSTVAKLLVKLEEPDSGRYVLEGEDVTRLSVRAFRPKRRVIQMIFQDPYSSLNPQHTVARSITAGPLAAGVSPAQAMGDARRLISRVGLDESALNRFPHEFSGGQRQRIGIARALAMSPRVLVADESVSALDVSVQAKVLDLLADLQREYDLGLIFITHDLRVACQISDNLVVMHRGRIVERGTAHDVLLHPKAPYTQALVAALPGQEWEKRREAAIFAERRA